MKPPWRLPRVASPTLVRYCSRNILSCARSPMPLGFEPALRKLQMNPNGIPPQSPGLRAACYPGLSDFILSGWSAAENVQTPPADGSRRTLAGADGLAPAAVIATKAACAIRSVFAGRAAQECENRNPKSEPRTSNEGANGIYWNHASRITHHASCLPWKTGM